MAAVTALLVGAAGLAACDRSPPDSVGPPPPEVSTPQIKQARWKIRTGPTGAVGKITRADRKRARAQRPKLARLIRDVYDSLFLYPSRKNAVLRNHFSRPAARKIMNSRAGVPRNAELVRTRLRRAVIGIQPDRLRRAAAVVTVRVTGRLRDRVFRIAHRSTLWLERSRRPWRVIAFEVIQRPVKERDADRKRHKRDGKRRKQDEGERKKRRRRQGGKKRR